ncbi:YitT family protein [Sphingomonas sp. RP10(2022)]|uniref:YitT family protein n=1 Tax=Sphingomonas liriopis TaxID=2949094 RepID=A0A9X2HZB7_9SPHN|nr:YitT family protein [Sphingomonas liriopis]MCP3736353.1 YitT family protein [Sphingomonas liriopis]
MQPRDPSPPPGRRHSIAEDAYALAIGCILIVLGLAFLKAAGLVTGGVAGLALLLSYRVPLPVGVLFTLLNIPFFAFAHKVMGARFAAKSLLVNIGIALFSSLTRASIHIEHVHPAFAALVGGTVIGMGILALARHHAGVGGTGVITLWLQRTRGWNAGRSQIAIDIVILAAAIPVVSTRQLAWSALSAAAMSLILIAWHRPGRYIGH